MKRICLFLVGLGLGFFLLTACGSATPGPTLEPNAEDIPRISAQDLWERLQAGEAVLVVDTRSLASFEIKHITGAVSMPMGEISQRIDELPRDSLIAFY